MMKRSLLSAACLLVLAVLLGSWNQRRLEAALRDDAKATAEAARAGVVVSSQRTRSSLRVSGDSEVQRALGECHAAIRAARTDINLSGRILMIGETISATSRTALAIAISEDLTIPPEQRALILFNLIDFAAPQVVLELALNHLEWFVTRDLQETIQSAFFSLAEDDPDAALTWAVKLHQKSPQLMASTIARVSLDREAGMLPPQRVFEWFRDMGRIPSHLAFQGYFSESHTPAQQVERMATLRQYAGTLESSNDQKTVLRDGMLRFGNILASSGFEKGKTTADSTILTAGEATWIVTAAFGDEHILAKDEAGRWIEWTLEKFPDDLKSINLHHLLELWSKKDPQTAGVWLGTMPEGKARTEAVSGYIQSVRKLDPQTARQWAMTLPPAQRDRELFGIQKASK